MTLTAKGCGSPIPEAQIPGTDNGGYVNLQITGADPDLGGTAGQVIDMTAAVGDYVPPALSLDKTFQIVPETAAAIEVQLANGDDYTITAVQADAYLGQPWPGKLLQVYKAGTTGKFSTVR